MPQRLARNTLIGFTGLAGQRLLAFVTTLVLARGLGPEGFGIYAFAGVYIFFFGFLADLGIEKVVTREIASHPQQAGHLLGNAILLKLGLCAVAVPAAWAVAWWWDMGDEARACVMIAALGLPLSIETILRSFFQSRFAVHTIYAITLPAAAFLLALAALCVYWELPVRAVFIAALFTGALALGGLLIQTMRQVRLRLQADPRLLRTLLRDAAEVGVFLFLIMVSMRLDQLLVFQLRGALDAGHYAAGMRVAEGLSMIPEALMLTVYPLLAATQHTSPERFRRVYTLSFKYLSAAILPIALVITLARNELVALLFGAAYAGSAVPLAILAWGTFFAYVGTVSLNLFIVRREQRVVVLVSVIGVAVNIVANLLLIPAYGATGAALAMVIGNSASFAAFTLIPRTAPFMRVCMAQAVRPAAAVGAAWCIVAPVPLPLLPTVTLALAIYTAVMVASRGITRDDVVRARRWLQGSANRQP